jgi:hypothetical protein
MALYALHMLEIAIELALTNDAYQDTTARFLDDFLHIAQALYHVKPGEVSLWDEQDQWFYDVIRYPNGTSPPVCVRSFAGIVPFLAAHIIKPSVLRALPRLQEHIDWLKANRPELVDGVMIADDKRKPVRLSVLSGERLSGFLSRLFSDDEFLGPYGIRSLSKIHEKEAYTLHLGDNTYSLKYEPGDAQSVLMGGNSNWRGPIWAPINRLVIEALRTYHLIEGDQYKVACPAGSRQKMSLDDAASQICERITGLLRRDTVRQGKRPVYGDEVLFQTDPHWRDYISFYEYFHADRGTGMGASHQNGWTALIAELLQTGGRSLPQW